MGATTKSEKGFQEIVDSFKQIINEAILPLETAHGSSSWQIAGDWNVRALGLGQDALTSIQRDAKRLSRLGMSNADAFNSTFYDHFMNRRYGLKLWAKLKKTESASVLAEYSKQLNKLCCSTCKGKGVFVGWFSNTICDACNGLGDTPPTDAEAWRERVTSVQQSLLKGDGVRLVNHVLLHKEGTFSNALWKHFEWVEPSIEFDVTYPVEPTTGRYAEGTHQVPSYLDRIILWRSKHAKMEPGLWFDMDYTCLRDVTGSDHLPVQKQIKFVWTARSKPRKQHRYTPHAPEAAVLQLLDARS